MQGVNGQKLSTWRKDRAYRSTQVRFKSKKLSKYVHIFISFCKFLSNVCFNLFIVVVMIGIFHDIVAMWLYPAISITNIITHSGNNRDLLYCFTLWKKPPTNTKYSCVSLLSLSTSLKVTSVSGGRMQQWISASCCSS